MDGPTADASAHDVTRDGYNDPERRDAPEASSGSAAAPSSSSAAAPKRLQAMTDRLWRQDEVDWNANRRILINYLNSGKADQE